MTGRILIADDVATNRIILKVKLAAARYDVVQAEDVPSLLKRAHEDKPDLIITGINLPGGGISAIIEGLKANPHASPDMALTPVIAVAALDIRHERLSALSAGADEVLARPLDEQALLALIRNLTRSRVAVRELAHKQNIAEELGFSEASQGFMRQARIALVAGNLADGISWRNSLKGHLNQQIRMLTASEALENDAPDDAPDIFVISATLAQSNSGLQLVSELRARQATQHAMMVVHNPSGDAKLTTMALDMGANTVLNGAFDADEVAIRLRKLIRRKLRTDALRTSLDKQLSLAMSDPLTGLFNRRYAQNYLTRISKSAMQDGQPFTLMILDLDRFKRVNDCYGHAVGDEVLVEVARRLKASLREIDLLARFGGEEFLVVLPNTNAKEASRAAERLRRVIGDTPVYSATRSLDVAITMSIGVVVSGQNPASPDKIEKLLDRADRALYLSKADGRNQITFVRTAA